MFMNMKRTKLVASGIAACFLLIHILMINIFYQCKVFPMVYFNIFSICFYFFALFLVYKERLALFTVTVYLEVALHMALAVLLTGWESGFQVTLIGMNVLAFYAEYTGHSLKIRYVRVMPMCVLGMLLYLGSYVFLHLNPPPYALPEKAKFWLTLLWGIIVFVINLFVLQLFVYISNTSEEALEYQLSHDKLTGLPNRYFLSTRLDTLLKEKDPLWIAISDIDNFKSINDTYGHNCGDYVLRTIGGVLACKGILCCRWGGEEFLFIDKIRREKYDPCSFLEEVRSEIERLPLEYEGNKLMVTMTFGMSEYHDGDNIDSVIKDADDRLYSGKHSGKNRVVTSAGIVSPKTLSHQDQLTRVKNRSAYEKMVESLNWDIQKGTVQFAIVRVHLKNVDEIAKKYGKDKSNAYIAGASRILCEVFINSQVFRICEDEFVTIITTRDYYDREALFAALEEKYKSSLNDKNETPWNKYAADCKMSVYTSEDKDYISVFER